MVPPARPLQQLSQASKRVNRPDPKSTKKRKAEDSAPRKQNDKVRKPLPAPKSKKKKDAPALPPWPDPPDILPPEVSSLSWEDEHGNDNEEKKASVKHMGWPRFNLNAGWRLLNERQQLINEWKASDSLSPLHAKLLKKFEELQPDTARRIWITVQEERRYIEFDMKLWNEGRMPETGRDEHSLDRLKEQMGRVRMAEVYISGVYKSVIAPLVEAEVLAKEKRRLDKEEMDRMVKDAYQEILAEEARHG